MRARATGTGMLRIVAHYLESLIAEFCWVPPTLLVRIGVLAVQSVQLLPTGTVIILAIYSRTQMFVHVDRYNCCIS